MGNTKFRIGDKVKVVGVTDHRSAYNGVVFVIRSINPNGVYGATKEHYGIHSDDVYCSYVFYVDELELVESAPFTKADLEPGMVVEYRNGERRLFVNETFMGGSGYSFVSDFTDDLKFDGIQNIMDADNAFDIVKVYRTLGHKFTTVCMGRYLTLVWERKEEVVKEMTVAEIEEKLGYKVKIVDGE